MVNVVGLFFTEIVPWCCSIMDLQLASPNPVPSCLVVYRGSKILFNLSSGIPGPESSILITVFTPIISDEILIFPSLPRDWIAL